MMASEDNKERLNLIVRAVNLLEGGLDYRVYPARFGLLDDCLYGLELDEYLSPVCQLFELSDAFYDPRPAQERKERIEEQRKQQYYRELQYRRTPTGKTQAQQLADREKERQSNIAFWKNERKKALVIYAIRKLDRIPAEQELICDQLPVIFMDWEDLLPECLIAFGVPPKTASATRWWYTPSHYLDCETPSEAEEAQANFKKVQAIRISAKELKKWLRRQLQDATGGVYSRTRGVY